MLSLITLLLIRTKLKRSVAIHNRSCKDVYIYNQTFTGFDTNLTIELKNLHNSCNLLCKKPFHFTIQAAYQMNALNKIK